MVILYRNKQKLQISVQKLHNDMILPISEGFCFGDRTSDRKIFIGVTSLRKYMPKNIKTLSNIKNITCGCETCICAWLLQLYINKWRWWKLSKLNKLYNNSESTKFLQRSNNYFIEYKNKIFPNNSHIYLRACDAASSNHFNFPINGSNIPNLDF